MDLESGRPKQSKTLPPCRVCGHPAAGFHYGVNTCDACKGFFHRSLNLHRFYVCKQNETCQNKKGSKRMCRKCRYDRCVAAGMAVEAIKTGRYPASKHTSDILELQKLKTPESLATNRDPPLAVDCCDASGFSSRCLQNLSTCPSYLRLKKKGKEDKDSLFMLQCVDFLSQHGDGMESLPQLSRNSRRTTEDSDSGATQMDTHDTDMGGRFTPSAFPCSSSSLHSRQTPPDCGQMSPSSQQKACSSRWNSFPLTPISLSEFSPSQPQCPSMGSSSHTSETETSGYAEFVPSPCNVDLSGPWSEQVKDMPVSCEAGQGCVENINGNPAQEQCKACGLPLDPLNVEELYQDKDHIIQILLEAREKFLKPISFHLSPHEMDRIVADHLDTCKMKTEMFGPRSKVPDAEYDLIFASTGIDADNRKERYEIYLEFMEKLTRSVVKFAKAIPGFSQLSTMEKENLIKSGLGEVAYLNTYQNSRPDIGVICGPDNKLRCILDCTIILDETEDILEWFDCSIHFSRSLQQLHLSEEEETLIYAIAIMAPDRGLFSPDTTARAIHEELHECLIHYLKRTRGADALLVYAKVVDCLVLARTVSHLYAGVIRQINLPKYSLIQKNPLLREMMTGFVFGEFHDVNHDGDFS